MTFTAEGSKKAMIEVAQGSHVYTSEGDRYAEWADLTTEQREKFLQAQSILEKAFSEAKAVVASVSLPTGKPGAASL